MSLEQMREPVEPDTFEQSILSKRLSRKRKIPFEEEVYYILISSLIHVYISVNYKFLSFIRFIFQIRPPPPAPAPPPPVEVAPEAVEVPSIVPPPLAESPVPLPEVSLPLEPSVPEISGMVPLVEEAEIVPSIPPEVPLISPHVPEIPPTESIVPPEEPIVPPTPAESELPAAPPTEMPQMENMGYDQVSYIFFKQIYTIVLYIIFNSRLHL